MNSTHSPWSNLPAPAAAVCIRKAAADAGAVAVGFAEATRIPVRFINDYNKWIASGFNGSMDYLARLADIRFNPEALLPGVRTVISMAFPYRPVGGYHHPNISDYALGEDYHTVVRRRLLPLVHLLAAEYGAMARICVDTAPLPERYWAVRAGIGFVGLNRQLIVPGVGSGVFLAEVLTSLELPPSRPLASGCGECGACVAACPGGALADNCFDARRCLSYLTIEHRGERTDGIFSEAAYGCDVCQRVCPHNAAEPPEPLKEFRPDPRLLSLGAAALANLSSADWRRLSKGTARTRLRYADFIRNTRMLKI